jgi:uncharacterized protein (UPF0297 family)
MFGSIYIDWMVTMNESRFSETQKFNSFDETTKYEAKQILTKVYSDLKEKGYNPVNQIVGYILSGDPTYITSQNNARALISKMERDELLEEIVCFYIKNNM